MFHKANPLLFERAKELRKKLTHAELVLWGYVRTRPLGYKFRRQHPLGIYILDFFCYKLRLVIEVDGSIHELEEIKKYDAERQAWLESEGFKILRFTNDEVCKNQEDVFARIESFLHHLNSFINQEGANTPPLGGRGVFPPSGGQGG